MSARATPGEVSRSNELAVVLGAGGIVGTAWMAGLASGMRQAGVDLAEADLIVGTSAGAIVGAVLATGQDPGRLAVAPRPADLDISAPRVDHVRLGEVFGVLGDPGLDAAEARRRVGHIALIAETGTEAAYLARMDALVGAGEWPQRELLVTAVDSDSGELKVFDRGGDVPLLAAVAASAAFPATAPPVSANGRRYMDGGLRSAANADLVLGARMLVVVEPLAHLFPREPFDRELIAARTDTVVTISPDAAAVEVFGPDLNNRATWQVAYRAGIRQAVEAVHRVRPSWRGQRASPT